MSGRVPLAIHQSFPTCSGAVSSYTPGNSSSFGLFGVNRLSGVLIDLVTMEEWLWQGEDLGASWVKAPIRDGLKSLADDWRNKMIEAAVEMDDDAMMMYLEGEEPDVPTLRKLLRKGTLEMAFVPVLGGSAF